MKKQILLFLLCALSTFMVTAQIQNVLEGPNSLDTAGVLTIFSNNDVPSNSISAEGNDTGLPGASFIYSYGNLAGFSSTWTNYGVWGHQTGEGVGGQGGLFTYGADRNSPDRFVRLATGSHGLQIVDGNEAAGYVLTSDATGRASWAPAGSSPWTLTGNNLSYDVASGVVSIGAAPDENSSLYVEAQGSGQGADTAAIYARREGGSGALDHAGTAWSRDGVTCAVKGYSHWGNNFSAGVAGFSFHDYNNSAATLGAKWNGDVWGALGYQDNTGREWGGYIGAGDFHVAGLNEGVQVAANDPANIGYVGGDPYSSDMYLVEGGNGGFPILGGFSSVDSTGVILAFGTAPSSGLRVLDPKTTAFTNVDASAFNVISDRTVKKEIEPITNENDKSFMESIRNIESATFRYLHEDDAKRTLPHIGVIAQTLPPEVVVEMDKNPVRSSQEKILGMSLADLLGLTLVGVKHLDHQNTLKDQKIAELEARIDAQNQELSEVKSTLTAIQNQLVELSKK